MFDMDYLEVTKNESLRKYEENAYLLGTIFSNKVKKDELSDEDSSDLDSDESSIEEEIINLFDSNKTKEQNKSFEKFNQIKSKIESDLNIKDGSKTTETQSLFGIIYR